MLARGHDEVVVQGYLYGFQRLLNLAGHFNVWLGGGGITARVVMGDDERSSAQLQRAAHHLARVGGGVVDGAALLHLVSD